MSGINKVKDLFVIPFAFGQFTIKKSERVVCITGYCGSCGAIGVKKACRLGPCTTDEIIEPVAR
jgi:hypothetical protein